MLPRTGVSATLSITAHVLRPSGNATVCRSGYRLNPRTCFRFFLAICFPGKNDRAAFAGGPSQGGNALGKGSDSGGWDSYRVSYFANPKTPRIDEAQFSAHDSRATVRIAADQVGETRTPCSKRNARTTLIASATKRPRVSASASASRAVILRSNTIDVPLATSAQLNVRARNGFASGPSVF